MALSYKKYTTDPNLKPQLVTKDAKSILGLHQGSNGFANLIICIAEAWYEENIKEDQGDNDSLVINEWQKNYKLAKIYQPWCEVFTEYVISEAIKNCPGLFNDYPKANSSVRVYKKGNTVIPYNWDLSPTEISQNGLTQAQDSVYANAFRAATYIKDKLRGKVSATNVPTAGSKFYRYSEGNSSGHTGIVIAILYGYFYTIEGNVEVNDAKTEEGIGMYRYPMAAASNIGTGFEFYDFSRYPSNYNKANCENNKFSYTYTGIDGKQKTRNCWKPVVEKTPDVVVETPPEEKTPDKPKPPTPPVKKDCVPLDLKFSVNESVESKKVKCQEFIKVKIPSVGLVQYYEEMKNDYVTYDIVKLNGLTKYSYDKANNKNIPYFTKFTANQEKIRNGSALWYKGANKDTGKATGFGMFKDQIGNIIYILDENNQESLQLLLSGLLGFNIPDQYIDNVNGVKSFKQGVKIGDILYKHRSLCNSLFISSGRADKITEELKEINSYKIREGKYSRGNGFYNSNGNFDFGEDASSFITWDGSYGLDFNREVYNDDKIEFGGFNQQVWKINIPLKDIQAGPKTKTIDIYKLLRWVEERKVKIEKPIIIFIDKPTPPPPLLSQDFFAVLEIVGSLTAVAGIPIPIDAIINGAKFASSLEQGVKKGFNVNTIVQGINFAKGVIPNTIKGIEDNVTKFINENTVSLKDSIKRFEAGAKEILDSYLPGKLIQEQINKLGGEVAVVGKYFQNASKSLDFIKLESLAGFNQAQNILGLDASQIKTLVNYYDNEGGKSPVIDMRMIVNGFDFKTALTNVTNIKAQLAAKTIIDKINTDYNFIEKIQRATNITNIPLIQEIMVNGLATDVIGMFPKAPELANGLVQSKLAQVKNASDDKLRSYYQDERANLIAAGMGYNLEICDIFKEQIKLSLVDQAQQYAKENVPFFMPQVLNGDVSECYKFEIEKYVKGDIINCPDGWNYDPKTNRCYNEKTTVTVDFGGGGNFEFDTSIKVERILPKCIQQSFGSYVFYYKGMPLVAVPTNDNRWIASWGGKNYFIDTVNCTLLGVPTDTSSPNEPPIITNTPPIPLPKCITIRNSKYWYNPRLSIGLNDNVIAKELTDLYANTKTPIGGASPEQLVSGGLDLAKVLGIDTSKVTNAVTNNPTVSSVIGNVNRVDNLINSLNQSAAPGTSKVTSSPVVSNVTTPNGTTSNPVTTVLTSPNTSNVTITQVVGEEEAFLINGKWYLLRNGKYIEIIDCIPVAPKVYQCGIIEKDGGFVFNYNGKEYTAVKNYDDKFYVFINGIYYTLDANCNPITPKPGTKECDECEKLVEVEKQNRIKLEKAFSESKVSNDSKIKELINLLNTQTQKTQELEKQMILRSGGTSTNNDSKYNELLSQLQSERERVNQLQRLIEQSKTGGNNYDSIIEQINNSLRQEKERSNRLEIKIAELEKQKSNDYFTDLERRNDNDYRSDVTTDISKEEFREEKLPNCITLENGNYYFTGMVHKERLQLKALQTVKGWIAEYQSKYYYIDLANCTLLIDSKKIERSFTGECNDCVKNTQPRIVERKERIIYGGHENRLDPEVYEDCDEC